MCNKKPSEFTTGPGLSATIKITLNNATIFNELCEFDEPLIATRAGGVCEEITDRRGFARDAGIDFPALLVPDPNGGALVPI